jgi:Legume lectin domain/Bacterial lectin
VGPGALGAHGGGLGYAGIPNSVAIKFDLFSNAGEGPDSTGLYINGAMPTVPALNLTGTGIDLHSGDYMDVHITYDGTTLNLTITDNLTLATWSHSFAVNIPAIVGGNTAFVGFTAGTGHNTASQKINAWTYEVGSSLPNYPAGFDAAGISLNNGASLNGTRLRLTNGKNEEARSAFFTTPVSVQQFSTSFNFQVTDPNADGFTFAIQSASPRAVGGVGQGLGYTPNPLLPAAEQIGTNSLAVKFDLFNNEGEGPDSTGLYLNGAVPTIPAVNLTSTGINLHSGDIFNVQMGYDGVNLTVVITDTVTQATATHTYAVDIPSVVGAAAAYVGFTAGAGGSSSIQEILDWTYSTTFTAPSGPTSPVVPSYSGGFTSASSLTLNNGAALSGTRLRLTDSGSKEARSVFFTTPLDAQSFTTNFSFQLTGASADGFTFTIQDAGLTALGGNGGELGYEGISNSVAIKFDLFSNGGEGPDSTGLYLNGALPTAPATDLTPTGINLHSGDIYNVSLTYNGTALTAVITDTVTNATATQTYTVNIPAIVGGPTAYFGFTAATGGLTATQEILSWSYTPGT